ncbi:hypothetical protein ACPW96_22680 [Micromonospora sp. DT81.3]|uniref:hypothetical protein n=1 Tax=Micromonospora sp. DT81.3 TaxID=3416523 RepID=UPI003CF48DF2
MSIYDNLTEQLVGHLKEVPQAVEVVSTEPVNEELPRAILQSTREATGLDFSRLEPARRKATTVLRDESGARATVFHASGAIVVRTAIGDFDDTFAGDPGSEELSLLTQKAFSGLGIDRFVHGDDTVGFERLWRIRAAGADPRYEVVEPVLVRAIGAFRHNVRDIPVLGRASGHVEVTGAGDISAFSVSMRRFADQGSEVLTRVSSRAVEDAASEIAKQAARVTEGSEDAVLTVDSFDFGYLSLGRRRAQAVLAPMYVAAVSIAPPEGREDQVRSAHIFAVPGSDERFLKLPTGSAAVRTRRAA